MSVGISEQQWQPVEQACTPLEKHGEFMDHHFYHVSQDGIRFRGGLADVESQALVAGIQCQGGLSYRQMERLIVACDRLARTLSEPWSNRHFRVVNGALPSVDSLAEPPGTGGLSIDWGQFADVTPWLKKANQASPDSKGAVLMHERCTKEDRMNGNTGRLGITGSGFPYFEESLKLACERDLNEQLGGAYWVKRLDLNMVKDIPGKVRPAKMPEQRISFVFRGALEEVERRNGAEVNGEKARSAFIPPELLNEVSEEYNVDSHFQLTQRVSELPQSCGKLTFMSQEVDLDGEAFVASVLSRRQADFRPDTRVELALDVVERALGEVGEAYRAFADAHLPKDGCPVPEDKLWTWMMAMTMGISRLSSLFQGNTGFRLLPREGGGISMAALLGQEDKILVFKDPQTQSLHLPETDHQHGEVLGQTLLRLGVEWGGLDLDPSWSPELVNVADLGQKGRDGVQRRTLVMTAPVKSVPPTDGCFFLSKEELSQLPEEAWAQPHHKWVIQQYLAQS